MPDSNEPVVTSTQLLKALDNEPEVLPIQRYDHVYGENPLFKGHMTSVLKPNFYHGPVVKYEDHERVVNTLRAQLAAARKDGELINWLETLHDDDVTIEIRCVRTGGYRVLRGRDNSVSHSGGGKSLREAIQDLRIFMDKNAPVIVPDTHCPTCGRRI